jgi:hypothetical protein
MALHVPTMLVTTILSTLIVAAVLPLAGLQRGAPGVREATLSALSFAACCGLILARDQLPDATRIVASNGLMWLAFALQWLAYRRFDAPSAAARLPLGLTGLAVLAFAVLYAAGADYRQRSLLASAVVAMLSVASAWELTRGGRLRRERARSICLLLSAVTAGAQVVRVPLLLALPSGDGALLSGTLEQSVAFFPAMIHVLGAGLGFLVMHLERNEATAQGAALTDPLTGCANRRAFAGHVAE